MTLIIGSSLLIGMFTMATPLRSNSTTTKGKNLVQNMTVNYNSESLECCISPSIATTTPCSTQNPRQQARLIWAESRRRVTMWTWHGVARWWEIRSIWLHFTTSSCLLPLRFGRVIRENERMRKTRESLMCVYRSEVATSEVIHCDSNHGFAVHNIYWLWTLFLHNYCSHYNIATSRHSSIQSWSWYHVV